MALPPDHVNLAAELIRTGFAVLERPLHPVQEHEIGSFPFLHWPARGRKGAEFTEEFFALDLRPAHVIATVQFANPGLDHLIAEISVHASPQSDHYLANGYEFGSAEPLMISALESGECSDYGTTKRLGSMVEVESILAAHASVNYPLRLFNDDLLTDPAISIRAIWERERLVALGKVSMLPVGAYLTDIMTMPDYRKRGHGAAIVRALHADAYSAGCRFATLTSTAMAQSLYHALGYTTIGTVTLYATPERN